MYPCNQQYRLPTISIVAGAAKNLYFPVTNKSGETVNTTGCTARFSAVNCANRAGRTVIEKVATTVDGALDVLTFTLEPKDTINLEGKFIYQIWVKDANGIPEEPQQGELYIVRNIDKTFI